MLLSVQSLEKQYGSHTVFTDLSFTIDEGHKIALVGKNGAGKSTLMRILAGEESPDGGSFVVTKGRTLAYAPQEVSSGDVEKTGTQYLQEKAGVREYQYLPILDGLGVPQDSVAQPISSMSGGQQSKLLLTAFLLSPADILLMDEPTNNLDIPSLIWLETFLAASKKAMVIISHDLVFLDTVTNRVFELRDGGLSCERGTYSDYLDRKKKEHERQMRQYQAFQEKVQKLERDRDELKQKGERIDAVQVSDRDKFASGVNRDRASGGQQRVRSIEREIRRLGSVKKPYEEGTFTMRIQPRHTEGACEIMLEDVVAGYRDDGVHVGPVSMTLQQGERLCVMGANGSGKSTLLKTITGMVEPLRGQVMLGDGVQVGDLMQQHDRVDQKQDPISFFMDQTSSTQERAIHALKRSGFSERMFEQPIAGISPGMRARLLFAVFADLGVNTLILDEPTNHLDTEAVYALRDMLRDYPGIVLLVSHNRWFLNQVRSDRYYHISDSTLHKIADFDAYIKEAADRAKKMTARLKRMVH